MNARVLVTGAGGFVCSNIVGTLLAQGYDVIAADRAFDAQLMDSLRTEWRGRMTLLETDAAHLPAVDVNALVHGAAITASPEESGQTPEDHFRANMNPLLTMLEWSARNQVRRAIFLSSSAVYRQTMSGTVHETMLPHPHGLYAIVKQTMEVLVETLRDLYGRDVITLRLSNIYGLNEHTRFTRPRVSLVARMIDEALRTGTVTAYENSVARDWTFAPDIGNVIDLLLRLPTVKHTLYNTASEQVLNQQQIAEAIQAALPNVRIELHAGSDPNESQITRFGYLSSERLREETGFNDWTPFAEGIKQIIEAQSGASAKAAP